MQRVSTSSAVATLPTPPAGGTPGFFAKPDPVNSVAATSPGYAWYNGVQEELMAVIEGQGLTGNTSNNTQLRTAITKMIQAGQRSVVINNAVFAATVTTGKAVYWDAVNSRFDLAVADGSVKQNCIGFADVANGNVYAFGDAVLFAGLAPGRVYLDAVNPGGIVSIQPANAVYLGIAKSPNEIFVDIDAVGLTQALGDARYLLLSAIPPAGVGLPSGTPLWWLTPVCPPWALIRDGSAISRAAYPKLFSALCPTRSGTTASGTNAVTGLSTTTDMYVGMPVEAVGIPAGTTVSGITSATAITISANSTASATVPITLFYYGYGSGGGATTFGLPDDRGLFERGLDTGARGYETTAIVGNVTSGSQAVTGLVSTKGMAIGQPVAGNAIPAGSTVQSITSATAITISAPATATGATTINFSGGQVGNERADTFRSHSHPIWGDVIQSFVGAGALPTANQTGLEAWCTTELTGGAETRPRSRSYLPIIVF